MPKTVVARYGLALSEYDFVRLVGYTRVQRRYALRFSSGFEVALVHDGTVKVRDASRDYPWNFYDIHREVEVPVAYHRAVHSGPPDFGFLTEHLPWLLEGYRIDLRPAMVELEAA